MNCGGSRGHIVAKFGAIIWLAGINYGRFSLASLVLCAVLVLFRCVCVCVCVCVWLWSVCGILVSVCNLKFPLESFNYVHKKPTLGRRAPTLAWTEYNSNCSQWVAFCFALKLFCLFALQNCSNGHLLLCR